MASMYREGSEQEVAVFLTAMSSPVRKATRSPPQSPSFSPFYQGNVINPSLGLCDTPVPVMTNLPVASPLPDSTKNVLSPLPINAFERESVEMLSQLRDTPTTNRRSKPHRHLFGDGDDEDSNRGFSSRPDFNAPSSPGMPASQPPRSQPILEQVSASTAGSSSSSGRPSMSLFGTNSGISREGATGSPIPNGDKIADTPRTNVPKTPQSQIASGKRRRSQTRAASSSSKALSSQEEEDEEDDKDESPDGSGSPKPCKCKRSKCLKLYCDCFGANRLCARSCTCQDCHNTDRPEHKSSREDAIKQTLERNPNAFTSKILETSDSAQHAKGCHCKRSGCLKKYCECFALGVRCTEACKCSGCLNLTGSEPLNGSPAAVGSAAKSMTGSSSKKKRLSSEKKHHLSPRRPAKQSILREVFHPDDEGRGGEAGYRIDRRQFTSSARDTSGYTGGHHVQFMLSEKVPEISHPPSFSDLDDMVGGEQSMDSVVFFSSQESKGSLSSKRDPTHEKTVDWGIVKLPESITKRCFEWLDDKSLMRACCVSVGFAEVATSPNMWHYPDSSQSTQGSQ